MDNFDLKKYLAEGKLLKEELTWYIEDENEDVSFQNYKYIKEVGKEIMKIHPDISSEDLYKIIIMTGEQYSRDEEWHGDSIPSGNFVKAAVEIYTTDILAEGKLLKEELKAPSGWTEIKDLSDMHRSEEDDEIAVKAWDAPMEGWDEENKDIIVVRKEDDKFYLDGYIPFGSFDKQGPFDTYEEALKLAVEEMEAFKEDWDE